MLLQIPKNDLILVIDGNPMIHRAERVHHDLTLPGGQKIGGLYGMLQALMHSIEKVKPTKVVVVWDSDPSYNWRLRFYPNYKADRKPKNEKDFETREAVRKQVDWATGLLHYLPVFQLRYTGLEGDDLAYWTVRRMRQGFDPQPWLGNVLRKSHNRGTKFVCATIDRDWLQLVRWDCDVYLTDLDYLVTLDNFQSATTEVISELKGTSGVCLADFIKYKQLVGDTSDSVEGVRGIGPKTAVKLLDQGLSLEQCAEVDKKIMRDFDQVCLNGLLFDLRNYPYTPHLDEVLRKGNPPQVDFQEVRSRLERMKFASILAEWLRFKSTLEDLKV